MSDPCDAVNRYLRQSCGDIHAWTLQTHELARFDDGMAVPDPAVVVVAMGERSWKAIVGVLEVSERYRMLAADRELRTVTVGTA